MCDGTVNEHVLNIIRENGLETHLSEGKQVTIIGVVGDKTRLKVSSWAFFI